VGGLYVTGTALTDLQGLNGISAVEYELAIGKSSMARPPPATRTSRPSPASTA
jgi:hypothetical protein